MRMRMRSCTQLLPTLPRHRHHRQLQLPIAIAATRAAIATRTAIATRAAIAALAAVAAAERGRRRRIAGIEPAAALKAINTSSGRSLQTQVRLPAEVLRDLPSPSITFL